MPKSQMARIHPSIPLHNPLTAGDYRERDILQILGDGLPANFDVFHNLPWSSMHQGNQHFGELDLVVISPLGHILLIEVKAGAIEETTQSLVKTGVSARSCGRCVWHAHALPARAGHISGN